MSCVRVAFFAWLHKVYAIRACLCAWVLWLTSYSKVSRGCPSWYLRPWSASNDTKSCIHHCNFVSTTLSYHRLPSASNDAESCTHHCTYHCGIVHTTLNWHVFPSRYLRSSYAGNEVTRFEWRKVKYKDTLHSYQSRSRKTFCLWKGKFGGHLGKCKRVGTRIVSL